MLFALRVSGLIYMQARFYAPWYGRFLSPDPGVDQHFEETQSWNIYSYVRNNPTMQVDPNGEEVRVYTERLGGAALLGDVRHSWTRVKTDRYDKLIERGGDGKIKIADWYAGAEKRGMGSREVKVDRPAGVGEGDYRFENGILATAKTLKGNDDEGHKDSQKSQNSDAMPPYDKQDANCNGFTQFLLQENGGSANFGPIGLVLELLTRGEVHSAKTQEYTKKYEEYKRKEAERKKEEEKKKEDQPK